MKLQLVGMVLLGWCVVACGGKGQDARRSGSKESMAAKGSVDATAGAARRAPPKARPRKVELGGGCSCVGLAAAGAGATDGKALRTAVVARMDGLNQSMRDHMAKIDAAVPDEAKDRIAQPAALHKARRALGCRLDCVLHQFGGASPALWSYLEVAALFLDTARRAVARLAAPPNKRPKDPSLAQLTRLFNKVARSSNESIGLALLRRPTPAPVVGVDASSFRSKTRRWRDQLRERLAPFRQRWMPLVRQKKASGPALRAPVRLRVVLARLYQQLGRLTDQARTITCNRGAGCTKPQAAWDAVQRSLAALRTQIQHTAKGIRTATPEVGLAAGRQLSASTDQAIKALEKAALSL